MQWRFVISFRFIIDVTKTYAYVQYASREIRYNVFNTKRVEIIYKEIRESSLQRKKAKGHFRGV